jgi:hypothetical protein
VKKVVARTLLLSVCALIAFCLSSTPNLLIAQAQKPLSSADLLQMKTMGFDDQTIVNAIGANGVSLDTSVQGLIALKQSGLSEKVINAALAAVAPKSAPPNAPLVDNGRSRRDWCLRHGEEQVNPAAGRSCQL